MLISELEIGCKLVPYYDRGEILDGALDGQHLETCWIKDQMDALLIQIEGSARVHLEDGTMLRINYDGHNGYPFVPVSRILIERNIIPRAEMSIERIREWMRTNPRSAEEVRRQNQSFVFFRICEKFGLLFLFDGSAFTWRRNSVLRPNSSNC